MTRGSALAWWVVVLGWSLLGCVGLAVGSRLALGWQVVGYVVGLALTIFVLVPVLTALEDEPPKQR